MLRESEKAGLNRVASYRRAHAQLNAEELRSPLVCCGGGKIVRVAFVIRTVKVIEGRSGEQGIVAIRSHPREIHKTVAFSLRVRQECTGNLIVGRNGNLVEIAPH